MRLGFGTTVLRNGMISGHVDGIGVYTRHLLKEMNNLNPESYPVNFGRGSASLLESITKHGTLSLPFSYQTATLLSLVTSQSFPGSARLGGRIDLFHAPDHYIPKLGNIPVVATVMDAITFAHPEWVSKPFRSLKNHVFRQMARSAQRIIAPSEFSKANIVHYFGISPERVSVTHLGTNFGHARPLSEQERQAVLRRHGLERGFFISVGTIQPRKNLGRILSAHRMLSLEMQIAHPLIVVGRSGWCTEDIIPDLRALQINGRGRWLESVSDVELRALLQSACALVYPSLHEGFGLPVLEGFAAGIPVISSNTTSIPEVAGDAALLVNPESTEEIANAMQRIVEDSALGAELVERGRRRVQHFSWENCAKKTLNVYQSL